MKNMISIFMAIAAFASLGVTPNTEWQDVPGTDKVGDVVSSVGAITSESDPVWSAQKSGYQSKLVSGESIKTVNGNSLLGSGNIEIQGGGAARPLPPYLHALSFDSSYPDDAAWYYALAQDYGRCSAVRDGGFLLRNYDWKFDDAAEFVVRMSAGSGRFASVGVANVGTNLNEAFVTSGRWSRFYKALPGHTVDGVNERGVVAEVNVVDGAWPRTSGELHCLGAVRWALDNATSAGMAASNLAAKVYVPQGMGNFHYMIADADSTWIVENGNAHKVDGRAAMTNFRLCPERDAAGEGHERYDALMGGMNITSQWWTLAYKPGATRYSDFGYDTNLTLAAQTAWANGSRESHRGKSFGGKTWWQTVHTSIYDITNRTLKVAVQETDDWYVFAVPSTGGVTTNDVCNIVTNTAYRWELSGHVKSGFYVLEYEHDILGHIYGLRDESFDPSDSRWFVANNEDGIVKDVVDFDYYSEEAGDYVRTTATKVRYNVLGLARTNDLPSVEGFMLEVTNLITAEVSSWKMYNRPDGSWARVVEWHENKWCAGSGDGVDYWVADEPAASRQNAVFLTWTDTSGGNGYPLGMTAVRERSNKLGVVRASTPTPKVTFADARGSATNYVMVVEDGKINIYAEIPDEN